MTNQPTSDRPTTLQHGLSQYVPHTTVSEAHNYNKYLEIGTQATNNIHNIDTDTEVKHRVGCKSFNKLISCR